MPSLAAITALQGRSTARPATFNTITSEDWKVSIASGRTRENKVAAQIHEMLEASKAGAARAESKPTAIVQEFSKQPDVRSNMSRRL